MISERASTLYKGLQLGLDMYLSRDVYVGSPRTTSKDIIEFQGYGKNLEVDKNLIKSFRMEIGYWRKANAIHDWFVRNVQKDVDDCEEYQVTKEQMIQLYEECSKAYLTKNPSKFQPKEGFFFGNTAIDEYYWTDIFDTMKILEPIIKELRKPFEDRDDLTKASDFYYRASW